MYFSDDALSSKRRRPILCAASIVLVSACLGVCILTAGCATHYYRVNDPVTGKTYYTDDLKLIEGDGIELKDAVTGQTVIIQNSEIKEISRYEFDTGRVYSGKTKTAL